MEFPRFDLKRFSFKEHRMSTSQGSYTIYFDGKEVITYGADIHSERDVFGNLVRSEDGSTRYVGPTEAQMQASAKFLWEHGHPYERIQPLSGWPGYVAADNDDVIDLITHEGRRLFCRVRYNVGLHNELQFFARDVEFDPRETCADGKWLATINIDQPQGSKNALPVMKDGAWFHSIGPRGEEVSLSSVEWHAVEKFARLRQKQDHCRMLDGRGWLAGNEVMLHKAYAEANRLACEIASFKDYMAARGKTVIANFATAYHEDDSYDLLELGLAPHEFVVDHVVMPSDLMRWMDDGDGEVLDPLWSGQFVEPFVLEGKTLRNPVLCPASYRPGRGREPGDIERGADGEPLLAGHPGAAAPRQAGMKL